MEELAVLSRRQPAWPKWLNTMFTNLFTGRFFHPAEHHGDEWRPEENDNVEAPPGGQNEELVNIDDGNARPPSPPPEQHLPLPADDAHQPVYFHTCANCYPFAYRYGDSYEIHNAASHPIYRLIPLDFQLHAADPALEHLGPHVQVFHLVEAEAQDNHPEMDVGGDEENGQKAGSVIPVENIGPCGLASGTSLSEDTEAPSTSGLSCSRRRSRDESDDEEDQVV